MAVTLGKDTTITGINNARSVSVSNTANEVDITKFGDTSRKVVKTLIEQTVEIECVDDPGAVVGDTFTLGGTGTGNVKYIVTNVAKPAPLDGIETWTVSGQRTP